MPECEQIGDATLYLGDCLDILPTLGEVDAVVTDPPYGGYEGYAWSVPDWERVRPLAVDVHGFWFWSGKQSFPFSWTARHIWSKANRNIGRNGEQYEELYEVGGGGTGLVLRHAVIDSPMNATINGDVYVDHPTQKPIRLMERIVSKVRGTVIDPFMGSGTTGVACANLGRKFIGIEIEQKYFDIACERIAAAYAQGRLFA